MIPLRAAALRSLASAALALALALVATTGCASATLPSAAGAFLEARRGGDPVGERAMLDDLATVPMVYFGEQHGHPEHQDLERRLLEGLVARRGRGRVLLGMEMFERPFQPVLDRWSAGELSEEEFLREVSWYEGWGFGWAYYRGVLLAARDLRVPVIALNADRFVVRAVGRGGIASLPPELRMRIPEEIPVGEGPHRAAIREVYAGHGTPGGTIDEAAFQRFYEAQVTWDETMAESAVLALRRAGPDAAILVLAGSMHVDGFHAIPERARRRNGLPYRTVLGVTVEAGGDDREPEPLPTGVGRRADWYALTGPHPGRGAWIGIALRGRETVVAAVPEGSPAAAAGLRAGDVLVSVGGRALPDAVAFRLAMEGRRVGEAVDLAWTRDGAAMTGRAILADPPPPTFR